MREQRPYGKHELYIEGDIITTIVHGQLTIAELHIFTGVAEEVIARQGYCLLLADNTDSGGIDAAARRYSAQWSIGKPVIGIAMYNAGLMARTVFSLVLKAANIIRKQTLPFEFFKTETEARDWLAQLRRQQLSKGMRPMADNSGNPASPPA